jgi:hypothetical protein
MYRKELPCFSFARILFTFSDLESVDSESSISLSLVIKFSSLNRTGFMILRLDLHIGCSMFVLFFGTWISWLFALELSDWVSLCHCSLYETMLNNVLDRVHGYELF